MKRILPLMFAAALAAFSQAPSENPPAPAIPPAAAQLAERLSHTLSQDLGVRTIVGEPVKVGSVTLIPILMVNFSFGGGGVARVAGPPESKPAPTPDGFYMSGEARPLGFVAVTKNGTRFITPAPKPAK